jgi:hypothetical protein
MLTSIMRIHGIHDVDAWAKRRHVEPQDLPCPGCGKELRTTIPIASNANGGRRYGLSCPPCECGEKFQPYTFFTPHGWWEGGG